MIEYFKDEYDFLSNFYPCKVNYQGRVFASVEHAYQSAKFDDEFIVEKFLSPMMTAGRAKRKSRELAKFIRKDWTDEERLSVMELCLCSKFEDPQLARKLYETHPEHLQEGNWWGDTFFGVDMKKDPPIGENHLGKLLMKIREEIAANHLFRELDNA